MLDLRYDPESRSGFVRLREGRTARTRPLSSQATADYGRRGELLSISLEDLDPTAAEFLRTSDEESLLAVIRAQTGKAVWTTPPQAAAPKKPKPAARPKKRR
ncbi:MAG TPA: hypothetical protein VGL44_04110 [Gaiellales bacterium]|jgi:hypothetical protein